MVISIWCGNGKPTVLNDFLDPFVNELIPILQHGISIGSTQLIVTIRCFICDKPAMAYIKGVVGHNSYNGCQKCMAEGVYSYEKKKMCFPRIATSDRERENEMRTDVRFRQRYQPQHHEKESALEKLPIDMIRSFPTSDSLHLLKLGIMKWFEMHLKQLINTLLIF